MSGHGLDTAWRRVLNRRQVVAGAAVVAGFGGVRSIGAQSGTPVTTESPVATTQVVETVMGPVEVPVRPERIVGLDSYSMADLVDAGVTPVGIPEVDLDGFMATYREALKDVPTTGPYSAPDVEKILLLKPDVILSINVPWVVEIYDQLTTVAPTVLFDYDVPQSWQVLADQFSAAVGRASELDAVKAHYAERTAQIKETYADVLAATTWAVAIGWGDADSKFALYYPDSPPGTVLSNLGVKWIAAAANGSGASEQISYERLGDLADADVILTYGFRDGSAEESTQAMIDQPLFQSLKAAQNSHVYIWQLIVPSSYGEALYLIDQVETVLKTLRDEAS